MKNSMASEVLSVMHDGLQEMQVGRATSSLPLIKRPYGKGSSSLLENCVTKQHS